MASSLHHTNVSLYTPPGLAVERMSSWPLRHQRRHYAIAEFNTTVMTNFQKVFDKLEAIEYSLSCQSRDGQAATTTDAGRDPCGFDAKLDSLDEKIEMVLNRLEHEAKKTPYLCEDLKFRVDSMELLLFRTSVDDFVKLDQRLAHVCDSVEPEIESSPCKIAVTTPMVKNEGALERVLEQQCINFDIYSNPEENDTLKQEACTSDSGISINERAQLQVVLESSRNTSLFERARHKIEQISSKILDYRNENDYAGFSELVLNVLHDELEESSSLPRTKMTRREYDKKYGNDMHKRGIWYSMCRKHFGNTGDPTAKPDEVLDIMNYVYEQWHKQDLTQGT